MTGACSLGAARSRPAGAGESRPGRGCRARASGHAGQYPGPASRTLITDQTCSYFLFLNLSESSVHRENRFLVQFGLSAACTDAAATQRRWSAAWPVATILSILEKLGTVFDNMTSFLHRIHSDCLHICKKKLNLEGSTSELHSIRIANQIPWYVHNFTLLSNMLTSVEDSDFGPISLLHERLQQLNCTYTLVWPWHYCKEQASYHNSFVCFNTHLKWWDWVCKGNQLPQGNMLGLSLLLSLLYTLWPPVSSALVAKLLLHWTSALP